MSEFSLWLSVLKNKGFSISPVEEQWLKLYFIQDCIEKEGDSQMSRAAVEKKRSILSTQERRLQKEGEQIGLSVDSFSDIFGYLQVRDTCAVQHRHHASWLVLEKELTEHGLSFQTLRTPYTQEELDRLSTQLAKHKEHVANCSDLHARGLRVGLKMPEIAELLSDQERAIALRVEIDDRESIWSDWDALEEWYQSSLRRSHTIEIATRVQFLKNGREAHQNFIAQQKKLYQSFKDGCSGSAPAWLSQILMLPLNTEGVSEAVGQYEFDQRWRSEWEGLLAKIEPAYRRMVSIPQPPLTMDGVAAVNARIKEAQARSRTRKRLLMVPRFLYAISLGLFVRFWKWNRLVAGVVLLILGYGGLEAYEAYHRAQVAKRVSEDPLAYVRVPAGTFMMGCLEGDDDCESDEKPAHKVTLTRDMYVMKYEVTQGVYKEIMGENPSIFDSCGDTCPVENVSWYDAVLFANALSKRDGLKPCYEIGSGSEPTVTWKDRNCVGWRLPTEAEWEYCARAGQSFKYSGSNNMDELGWYYDNSGIKTHPVGQKKANGFGLYDMSGNVWEWVWDSWKREYDSSTTDPLYVDTSSPTHVYRGGGWISNAGLTRVSNRSRRNASDRNFYLGFRFLRTKPAK